MKHALIAAVTTVAAVSVAGSAWSGEPRTIAGTAPVAGVETVQLDAGVGDITITAVDGAAEIAVEVRLEPRRGGFFSSMKRAQREVDTAELRMDASKGVLRLEVETDTDDHHFEETWMVALPARLAVDLDLGVGEVEIRGVKGGLTIDVGVGDLLAEGVSGDLEIDLGVGDAKIFGSAADYGSVSGSGGVGDARLTVRGEQVSSSGFVGHSAEWTGSGENTITISVGVGDARVTLE
jgi:hypothetical protein